MATSPLATDAVNLDLSQAKALTCHNMMCEHVGEPCGCRIAAFLERRSFPKLETLSLRGAGLRAVPDAVLRLPRLRELDLSRNELLRALPDDLAALESLETLDVTETALEALPPRLFDLPRLRRVAADAELLVAPAGWTAADGALERCVVVAAAASSRVRPPVAAPRRRAFGTSAAQAAENAADVRDLLRTRLSMTDADLIRVVRREPLGARATVEPKIAWLQSRLDLDAAQLRKIVLRHPQMLGLSVESMESSLDWLQRRLGLDEAGLRKMVLRLPSLFNYSVEDNLAPKLDFLAREIGLSRAELRDWVVKVSSLLSRSLANRYRPRLEACRAAGVDARRVLSYASQTDETFCERVGITLESVSV